MVPSSLSECDTEGPTPQVRNGEPDLINILPVENIRQILLYSVTDFRPCRRRPTTLALVCHKWSRIAREFPELWSHIYIAGKTSPRVLMLYLTRSRDMPLSVYFLPGSLAATYRPIRKRLDSGRVITTNKTIFDLVIRYSSRWRFLYVGEGEFEFVMGKLITIFPLPNLQSIEADIPAGMMMKYSDDARRAVDMQAALIGDDGYVESSAKIPEWGGYRLPNVHTVKLSVTLSQGYPLHKDFMEGNKLLTTLHLSVSGYTGPGSPDRPKLKICPAKKSHI